MRKVNLIPVLTFIFLVFSTETFSSSVVTLPGRTKVQSIENSLSNILSLKIKDLEKITGKKLSLKEKIELKLLKFTLNKRLRKIGLQKEETNKGQLALIFGIIGLASLLIPYVALIALPCAIIAIVLGYSARREDPNNKKAKTAIVLGWVTIGIFIVALIIAVAILATFAWY
jgi:hypothetical protein